MKMDIDILNNAKYTLRTKSLLKRMESERTRQEIKKKEPKEKQKPPPLSKYRRKTANARERNRMREINEAFESLQKTLPDLPGADADKLTKITVLKLAVNYIKILSCVMDGDVFVPNDIDEVKEVWCTNNAHMARAEHCVRSVFPPGNEDSGELLIKPIKSFNSKPKNSKLKNGSSFKLSDTLRGTQPTKKRTSKSSRNRGKICKTASVLTSNGAYITLKNVALQSSGRRPSIDNKPLMMSMTVKRARLSTIAYQRPPKFSRYIPPVQLVPKPARQIRPPSNTNSLNLFSRISSELTQPLTAISPLSYISHGIKSPSEDTYLTNFTLHDLDNNLPFIKNDFFFEFPLTTRHCSTSSLDSPLSNGSSGPPSPKSPTAFPMLSIEGDTLPMNTSGSLNTMSSPSFCSSDTDSLLAPATELDEILGSDPFEEELDHLTSSFTDSDDTLSFFLDHTSPPFISSDINSY